MALKPVYINSAAVVLTLGVLCWLGVAAMSNVRSVDIVVTPEVLAPDGRSEAVVDVRLLNVFGWQAWNDRRAQFRIAEGAESGVLADRTARSARVRSTFTAGVVVLHVRIEGTVLPYEVRIPVRRPYAWNGTEAAPVPL